MTMDTQGQVPAAMGPKLQPLSAFWAHWGFAPWHSGPLAGVSRDQRFVKDGFLGTIAEFHAWDCIIWDTGTESDRNALWRAVKPMAEVMTQRFVFLVPEPWQNRRIHSFLFGFRGYVEFHAYWPGLGGSGLHDARDLTDLVDMGLALAAGDKKA